MCAYVSEDLLVLQTLLWKIYVLFISYIFKGNGILESVIIL